MQGQQPARDFVACMRRLRAFLVEGSEHATRLRQSLPALQVPTRPSVSADDAAGTRARYSIGLL